MDQKLCAQVESLTVLVKKLSSDLEQSKQAAAILRANEQYYQSCFDHLGIGLAEIAPDGRLLQANWPLCTLLGYSRSEILLKSMQEITHPAERDAQEALRRALYDGATAHYACDTRLFHKDGHTVHVTMNIAAVPRVGGTRYVLASFEDITGRRTLLKSLERSARMLARVEATSRTGSWQWSAATDSVIASHELFKLFGMPPRSAPLPLADFINRIALPERHGVRPTLQRALAAKKPFEVAFPIELPDGKRRTCVASGHSVLSQPDENAHVLEGVVRDVSALKSREQALRESEERFRQLFDGADLGMLVTDAQGLVVDANLAACTLFGQSREALLGLRAGDVLLIEARTGPPGEGQKASRSIATVEEGSLKGPYGSAIPVEVTTIALQGRLAAKVVRNISERQRAAREAQRYAAEVLALYDEAPCGYLSTDTQGNILRINKTALEWLGFSNEEVAGKRSLKDLCTDQSERLLRESFSSLCQTGLQGRELELLLVRKDRTAMAVVARAAPLRDAGGTIIGYGLALLDMRALAQAQERLRQATVVFESMTEAIIITDGSGTILAVNKAFMRITGYTPDEVIGKNPRLLQSERHGDQFYRTMWDALEHAGTWQGEIWDRRKNGEEFLAFEEITAIRDPSGKVTEYVSTFSDITTIKENEQKLRRIAYYDPLTGLPNRSLFSDRMAQALARAKRHQERVAVLYIDLDRFKLINDGLGRAVGDQLLRILATRLREAMRNEDTVARPGGDEFIVMLAELGHADDAALLAQKLARLVAQPVLIDQHSLTMSASIGIGIFPDDAADAETLLNAAGLAMARAKHKGGNRHEFYTMELTASANESLALDRDLRHAIAANELTLLYQPQVSLVSRQIHGVEALVRWSGANAGARMPGYFIPVAEESNLIELIGDWVFDTVLAQIAAWQAAQVSPIRIAINMSVRQINRPDFVERICAKLAASPPLGEFGLDVEITETALQTGNRTTAALQALRSLGIKIAIDDFGTGYSCLNSLKHLPIDILKIDRSFIKGIPENGDDSAIAAAIIALGHSLGMRIVAEGIETDAQLRFLSDHGCDDIQGFVFFRPLSSEECTRHLRRGECG